MANIKQKFIKPGRDYNYSEGVKVKATATVYADQIVYVDGSTSSYLTVSPADADGALTANGRLMIAKHTILAGSYGIVLPWKLVTKFNTNAGEVGDPVYLHDSVTAAVAGNLTLTAPADAKNIVVGRITVKSATVGEILVNASAPEVRAKGGSYSANTTSGVTGSAVEIFRYQLADATAVELTMDYPVIVVDAHVYSAGATAATVTLYKGDATGNAIVPIVKGTDGDRIVYASGVAWDATYQAIPKGTKLTAKKSAAAQSGDLMYVTVIRA